MTRACRGLTRGELLESVVEGDQFEGPIADSRHGRQRRPGRPAAALVGVDPAGVVHQYAPHHLRRQREELLPVRERRIVGLDQAQPRLVNERRRLQRVTGAFPPEVGVGDLAKLPVDDRHQRVERAGLAAGPPLEKLRDVRRRFAQGASVFNQAGPTVKKTTAHSACLVMEPNMFKRNLVLGVAAGSLIVGAAWTTLAAFDPQPDPPAFGVVSITQNQTIRLNAVCSEHGAKGVPPGPCRAELMLHDAAGNVLVSQIVRLKPGQTTFLDYAVDLRTPPLERVGIIPCVLPDPERGRLLPTVEVFDSATGQTAFHVYPVSPRLSFVRAQLAEPR